MYLLLSPYLHFLGAFLLHSPLTDGSVAFPCSALLSKILLLTASQEAPATSSPLTTPVSRWHSLILFFTSQYALLPLKSREQETASVCVCVFLGECVSL